MTNPFRILTVCTGNICRSPLAELVLRHDLQSVPDVQIGSAGTHALVGRGMDPENIAIAREMGIPTTDVHSARKLTIAMLEESDLVLALDRGNRRRVVELFPGATRRTFTLREFARLAQHCATPQTRQLQTPNIFGGSTTSLVEQIQATRGSAPLPHVPESDDVIDPYRRGPETFARQAAEMLPALQNIVDLIKVWFMGLSSSKDTAQRETMQSSLRNTK